MKRMMILGLCVLLMAMLAIPVLAAGPVVMLADGAIFNPGSTVTVDIQKMAQADTRIQSAYQTGTVKYQWYSGNTPVPGATGQSYTIADSDKSIKVEVTCGDLVLTSSGYLITKVSIVVTKKTATPTTKAPTKATTKAPTAAPTEAPAVTPSTAAPISPRQQTEPVTTPPTAQPTSPATALPVAQATTEPAQAQDQMPAVAQYVDQPPSAAGFPWWTLMLVATVAMVFIVAPVLALRRPGSR